MPSAWTPRPGPRPEVAYCNVTSVRGAIELRRPEFARVHQCPRNLEANQTPRRARCQDRDQSRRGNKSQRPAVCGSLLLRLSFRSSRRGVHLRKIWWGTLRAQVTSTHNFGLAIFVRGCPANDQNPATSRVCESAPSKDGKIQRQRQNAKLSGLLWPVRRNSRALRSRLVLAAALSRRMEIAHRCCPGIASHPCERADSG